ncbi:hypothetical protein [Candidatus Hamiltonella defensa]|uniref:hypothetical protein n=1 Tax=Candidatus Williamhamiltonella defendens TaxID=138072 RepID=UPI0015815A03|nr:hypothetical protein [Candidatus Hamiltonella defensa]
MIPEIGEVIITQGNKEEAREFIEGLCVSLSAHYMIEEHMHGPGGGKAYMKWLTELVNAYLDNESRDVNDIKGIQKRLQRNYRRQLLGPVIKDLLNLQYSSDFYFEYYHIQDRKNELDAAKLLYEETFKKNGLIWKRNRKNDIFEPEEVKYKDIMESVRADKVNENIHLSFMSIDHATSIVVHKLEENEHIWSFYDPNFGVKEFNNYSDFRKFMNEYYDDLKSFEKKTTPKIYLNKFDGDKTWDPMHHECHQHSAAGELQYILDTFIGNKDKNQPKLFKLNKNITGQIMAYELKSDDNGRQIIKSLTVKTKNNKTEKVVDVELINVNSVDLFDVHKALIANISSIENLKSDERLLLNMSKYWMSKHVITQRMAR